MDPPARQHSALSTTAGLTRSERDPTHRAIAADWDTIVIGAGAAGLATALFTRRLNRARSVLILDGARRPGAKILVSGGSRCNVTNTVVSERDYWGGPRPVVRRVLRAFPASDAAAFFRELGVPLHEEEDGKLFPDSNSSRTVLDALLRAASSAGVQLETSSRVHAVIREGDRFIVGTSGTWLSARAVVLATGGRSLPKTGSDGFGYQLAQAFGHTLVPTTPALAPLVLADDAASMHQALAGVALEAELSLWIEGARYVRLRGPLLWTHFGISGPVALDMSRHWLRADLEGRRGAITASFAPDLDYAAAEQVVLEDARERPRGTVRSLLSRLVPASVADALLRRLALAPTAVLAQLTRDDRRRVVHALTAWPIAVTGSRGYNYAEVTAGGIDLREIDPATMESRMCRGLYLTGEILDVDGRLGGFNFQWAWSSGFVAARALARL